MTKKGYYSNGFRYRMLCLTLILCSTLSFAFRAERRLFSLHPLHSGRHGPSHCEIPSQRLRPIQASISADQFVDKFSRKKEIEDDAIVNLYDILEIHSAATKEEIKKAYFVKAKQTHPDTQRALGNDHAANGINGHSTLNFNDVSAAYKLLSDPLERKRYDRALQAQAFKEEVENLGTLLAEKAYPQINNLMENVAVPFLRRTTATTFAAAQKFADNTSTDWKDAFKEAVVAANRAGKLVDGMELLEQYEDLEKRARKSINQAYNVKNELDLVSKKRMNMVLHAPNSTITSTDALALLELWGITDEAEAHLSIFDAEMWSNSVKPDIADLEDAEQVLLQKNLQTRDAEAELSNCKKEHDQSMAQLDLAIRNEHKAQQALAAAKVRLGEAQHRMEETQNAMANAEVWSKKAYMERDRLYKQLVKKQEKVRVAMRRKQGRVLHNREIEGLEDMDFKKEITLSQVTKIKNEENTLHREYSRLAEKAATLLSRANKLKERADELENNM